MSDRGLREDVDPSFFSKESIKFFQDKRSHTLISFIGPGELATSKSKVNEATTVNVILEGICSDAINTVPTKLFRRSKDFIEVPSNESGLIFGRVKRASKVSQVIPKGNSIIKIGTSINNTEEPGGWGVTNLIHILRGSRSRKLDLIGEARDFKYGLRVTHPSLKKG